MPSELSTEFKTAFGRLLIGLKMMYTTQNVLNYSSTLIEYTRAGLVVLGRYDEYKKDFYSASSWYKEAIQCTVIKGRNEYVQNQILTRCFDINNLIFPIALKEGVLVLNEEMFSVTDMFLAAPPGGDQQQRRGGR